MADAATFREFLKPFEIVLVEPESDLLGANGSNLNVQILEFVAEFLKAVLTPELALGVIALEVRPLGFLSFIFVLLCCGARRDNSVFRAALRRVH